MIKNTKHITMPELPEVEVLTLSLKKHLIGKTIVKTQIKNNSLRYKLHEKELKEICHSQIISLSRRAKYILIKLQNKLKIIISLGMTGNFNLCPKKTKFSPYEHIIFTLDNGLQLRYTDIRRFGFIIIKNEKETQKYLKPLGVEPLSKNFSAHYLFKATRNKTTPIKSLIMNNKFLVGVGNIYANESLFSAKIFPTKPSKSLTSKQCTLLCQQIKKNLKKAIKLGGSTIKDFKNLDGSQGYFALQFNVYQQKTCKNCQGEIERLIIGGRSSFACPVCQLP